VKTDGSSADRGGVIELTKPIIRAIKRRRLAKVQRTCINSQATKVGGGWKIIQRGKRIRDSITEGRKKKTIEGIRENGLNKTEGTVRRGKKDIKGSS